jgi:Lrp/AsnC family transcriptional regulator for asnA, asnC and gidA
MDKALRNPEAVKELPEVLECHYTTGNWSILIIICRDNEHLMQLLNKIQAIEGFLNRTFIFEPTN